jgi:hypothetical protein
MVVLGIGSVVARLSTAHAGVQPLSSVEKEVRGHGDNCIAIQQEKNGAVHFEVFAVDFSTAALRPITAYFISVQITGQAVPVWEARGEAYEAVHRITYGVPPPGFENLIGPEQLIPGLTYRVGVRNPGIGGLQRTFLHVGTETRNGCPWNGSPQGMLNHQRLPRVVAGTPLPPDSTALFRRRSISTRSARRRRLEAGLAPRFSMSPAESGAV